MNKKDIKKSVREGYSDIAKKGLCCCSPSSSCCSPADLAGDVSKSIGYSEDDIKEVPEGANLGLGCGNPVALASLKEGDNVLDLGSGAGFDSFLASSKVGDEGKVIGVDMTPEMIKKATQNAEKGGYHNVEFRLGEIEDLPVEDDSIDIVISNCVINLSPDKRKVFEEAFRVLKPDGKLVVSDIVLLKELPEDVRESVDAYVGCIAGAVKKDEYLEFISYAGFRDVKVLDQTVFPFDIISTIIPEEEIDNIMDELNITDKDAKEMASSIVSIKVEGIKPN